ncbi:hypothetical protein G7A66_04465 [Altererythrobacter sp. SALINAS58]|uniref:hypothetical protein n=1 Tax=Alteripontixanthobacter muriae TaxID=2705546 RepID=UPI0015774A2D|nr:hypothetical protein [Alteripontixanthobacter muriae]NTZ42355.1 hypothetical protein [Alteripontixanthobacter muriae]
MRDYRTLKLLFIFWTFAFLVNSLRAHAVGELPFHLAGGHRLAAFAFAATMAFLLTRMLEKTDSVRARMIASGAALSIMPLAHSLFLKASCAMAPNEGVAPMTHRECVV